jgi:hypothetical protein
MAAGIIGAIPCRAPTVFVTEALMNIKHSRLSRSTGIIHHREQLDHEEDEGMSDEQTTNGRLLSGVDFDG